MEKLYTIRNYKNYIFDLIANNNKINKEIYDKFDIYIYIFFVLESEKFQYNLEEIMNSLIKYDIPLTKSEVEKFINDNKDEEKIFNLNKNRLQLKY